MNEVCIGFIGCGGNARGHMRRLNQMEGARIVAVCDVVEDLAKQAAELCQAQAYANHKAMLEKEELDAVYLSLPVFAHGEPELDVTASALPFFVEKPVALDMETALKVEEAVQKSGVLTCVGYQLRYYGATDAAREVLQNATIGLVVGKYWSGSGRGDPSRWVRQMTKSGGQLVEQATHTVDMMRCLGGEVVEVYAKQGNLLLKEIDCPDVNAVVFQFASGAIGSLTATWAYDPRDWSHANVVDITYDQALLHWSGTDKVTITEGGESKEVSKPTRSIDDVFVDAVRRQDGSDIRSPYSDALKSLALSVAANESGRTGKVVRVGELASR